MKAIKKNYQNLVIGFGKGGKTLAAYLAKQGQEVALIERSERKRVRPGDKVFVAPVN